MKKIVKKNDCWVLLRKQAFLDYKNIGLKRPYNLHFFKVLVQGFGQKFEILSTFRVMQNTPRGGTW